MKPISYSLRELLVSQGIANAKPVGAGKVRANKGRGAASDGALSQVKTSNLEGGLGYSPIGRQRGGWQPMGNSGKGREASPAPVVRKVSAASRNRDGRGRSPVLEVHTNPNMTDMAMRQTTQTPRAVAPRGVVSLIAIDGVRV